MSIVSEFMIVNYDCSAWQLTLYVAMHCLVARDYRCVQEVCSHGLQYTPSTVDTFPRAGGWPHTLLSELLAVCLHNRVNVKACASTEACKLLLEGGIELGLLLSSDGTVSWCDVAPSTIGLADVLWPFIYSPCAYRRLIR